MAVTLNDSLIHGSLSLLLYGQTAAAFVFALEIVVRVVASTGCPGLKNVRKIITRAWLGGLPA